MQSPEAAGGTAPKPRRLQALRVSFYACDTFNHNKKNELF